MVTFDINMLHGNQRAHMPWLRLPFALRQNRLELIALPDEKLQHYRVGATIRRSDVRSSSSLSQIN